jgi:hypothetical protein
MSNLKEKVAEFVAISKKLPENLQAICFELLSNSLSQPTEKGTTRKMLANNPPYLSLLEPPRRLEPSLATFES